MLSSPATRPGVASALIAALWFYAALGVSLNLIGPALEAIREDFGLAYAELAVALAAVGAGYTAGSIAGGILSDRVGRRPAIVLATLLAGLSIGAAAASGGLTVFVVAWLIAGIGLGGADGAITALISDVAGERAGTLLNVAHLAFAAGALMAPAVVGLMLSTGAGWRPAVWFAAALMLTSLVPFVRLQYRRVSAAPVRLSETIGEMASPVPLLLGVGLALYVGVEIGFGGFFAAFLEAEFALARPLATTLVSVFWIGLFVGRGVGAWLAARWDLYRLVLTALALTGGFGFLALLAPGPAAAVVGTAAVGASAGTLFPTIMAIGVRLRPSLAGALAGGLIGLAGLGGLAFPLAIGALADATSVAAGLLIVPAAQVIAFGLILLARRLEHVEASPTG